MLFNIHESLVVHCPSCVWIVAPRLLGENRSLSMSIKATSHLLQKPYRTSSTIPSPNTINSAEIQSPFNTNHLHSIYHKNRSNFDMSSNVLADKDINASATTDVGAGNSVKDVKSMEYHRQVLQSKLEDGQYVISISHPTAASSLQT